MKYYKIFAVLPLIFLSACSLGPVATSQVQTYSLSANSSANQAKAPLNPGVLVVTASSNTGFNNTNMYYQKAQYQLQSFAKNAWLNMPSEMIATNITQNLNQLGYFKAVFNGMNPGVNVTYTLNSRLISLYQDFTQKPSQMVFSVELTLIDNQHHKVLAGQIFTYKIPCTEETPYGGVLAANQALTQFLSDMDQFVLNATN